MSGVPDRCPRCSAAATAAASWCSLCYADLSAPPTTSTWSPPVPPRLSYAPPAAAASRRHVDDESALRPRRGRHAAPVTSLAKASLEKPALVAPAGDPLPAAAEAPAGPSPAELEVMLAGLAAQERPVLHPALRWYDNAPLRVAVMLGGTVVVLLVAFASLVVLGTLFG